MKKRVSILMLMLALSISGCSNKETIEHHYTYQGENDLWRAEYKVDSTVTISEDKGKINSESNKDSILTVTYKNKIEDLYNVKYLNISYDSGISGGSLKQEFDEEPPSEIVYTLKSGSTGSAIESEDGTIQVTIDIDGEIQTIELTNTK